MSAQTVPRQAYHRLPNGQYEVFVEDVSGRKNRHFFWASRTDSAVIIDTLPFDAVPADMEFGEKDTRRTRCRVYSRSRQSAPPCQEEPTSFSDFVAQQPNHVQRLLRECDLTEKATLKVVDLIYSTPSFVCGTDGGLLNGLGTFGYV
jgi:hypothetical protein